MDHMAFERKIFFAEIDPYCNMPANFIYNEKCVNFLFKVLCIRYFRTIDCSKTKFTLLILISIYNCINIWIYIYNNTLRNIKTKTLPWASQKVMLIVFNKISNIRFWNTLPWYIVRQAQVCYLPLLNFNFLF